MSTSGKKSYVAIKLPFNIGLNGTLDTTSDFRAIWQDRVKSTILTAKYERVNLPTFGTTLYEEIQNGVSGLGGAEERVSAAIHKAFADFLAPALSIKEVVTEYDFDSGTMSVRVDYKLPNDTDDSLVINHLSINKNSPPDFNAPFIESD